MQKASGHVQQTHRGLFVPLRPSKHARHGGKFKPAFIERRRAALELYLRALTGHKCVLVKQPPLRPSLKADEPGVGALLCVCM